MYVPVCANEQSESPLYAVSGVLFNVGYRQYISLRGAAMGVATDPVARSRQQF